MGRALLEITHLSKRFCRDPLVSARYAMRDILNDALCRDNRSGLRPGEFWALQDVNLHVEAGEVLGVIGHNGAGKSTLINVVSGILRPSMGQVTLHTDRVVLMDHQGGLSPTQTGRENIGNQLALHGWNERHIAAGMDEIIAFSELSSFVEAPVGTYSLGMKVRLAFAIYSRLRPDLFIVDEALNGGDLRFRMKFQRFLNEYIAEGGAILLASHDLFSIQTLCRRCVLMDGGKVCMIGDPEQVIHAYAELAGAQSASAWQQEALPQMPLPETLEPEPGAEASTPLPPDAEFADVVQIETVEISALDGGDLQPSGGAVARVVCQSSEDISPITCGLELGVSGLFPIATLAGGYGDPIFQLKRGRNEFHCRIERLPLLPGVHQMSIVFVNRENGVVLGSKGYQNAPVNFEIKGVPDKAMNMALFRKNIVHIPATWEAGPE